MFGVCPTEVVILAHLFLVIFGPAKAASIARDLGHFVNEAHGSVDQFKSELISAEGVNEARHTVEEFKSELTSSEEIKETRRSVEELKSGLAPDKGREDDQNRKP